MAEVYKVAATWEEHCARLGPTTLAAIDAHVAAAPAFDAETTEALKHIFAGVRGAMFADRTGAARSAA